MPQRYVDYGRRWQELNPDWQVWEWDEDSLCTSPRAKNRLSDFVSLQEVLDDLARRDGGRRGEELYVQMADVLAYELVYLFGGTVVNVDIEPVRPLSYMMDYYGIGEDSAYVGMEDDYRIVNAVMGGPALHPLYKEIIDRLPDRYFACPEAEMVDTTGPALLTDTVKQWPGQDVVVLPVTAFNSVHWKDVPSGGTADGLWCPGDGVVGVHHWGHRMSGRSNVVETATRL